MSDSDARSGQPAAAQPLAESVRSWIDRLELAPHPEGGFFRETWRSPVVLPRSALPSGYPGDRRALTSILFLLPTGTESRLHRVRSEELWLHHRGDPLELGIGPTVEAARDPGSTIRLGQGADEQLQAVVPPGEWQRALALPGPAGFALVGCVVAPGFEFVDFEMLEEEAASDAGKGDGSSRR